MSSLYSIQSELVDIFNQIEEAGGEITDEQIDFLEIKQEELKNKLNSYYKAIQSWTADIKDCKDEEKRIAGRRKVYENRINKLKKSMLDAIIQFGDSDKTNKYIELPTVRLSTRSSSSIEVDATRVDIFIRAFQDYVVELYKEDVLSIGDDDINVEALLNCINTIVKAEQGDDFEPFTIDDFNNIKLNISITKTPFELFQNKTILNMYGDNYIFANVIDNTTKEQWKDAISANDNITLAKVVKNESLQIK